MCLVPLIALLMLFHFHWQEFRCLGPEAQQHPTSLPLPLLARKSVLFLSSTRPSSITKVLCVSPEWICGFLSPAGYSPTPLDLSVQLMSGTPLKFITSPSVWDKYILDCDMEDNVNHTVNYYSRHINNFWHGCKLACSELMAKRHERRDNSPWWQWHIQCSHATRR